MPASSRLALQVKNFKEKRNGHPDPQKAARQLECPKKGDRIGVKLRGGQVQMAEYPDLEITEREPKAEVLERDFIHWKPILREL